MAIWQFKMVLIPKKGLLEKYREIPSTLHIDYVERKTHFDFNKEGLIDNSDDFKDALTQDWWSSSKIMPIEIIHQIDKKIRRVNYGSDTFVNWKLYSEIVDNDASMVINANTGNIEEISFRADLREENLKFLNEMVDLAKVYKCHLMDMKGNLAAPNLKEVLLLVKKSNSYSFLNNPEKFLTDLGNGNIKEN